MSGGDVSAELGGASAGALASASGARVVLVTFPDADTAARIARTLVGEALAACVNLVPSVRSIYAWQGEVHDDAEVLGVVKTTEAALAACATRFAELHPYDTPEFLALSPDAGSARYLAWLAGSVRAGGADGAGTASA
ncbi:MAG: divalent-cation tolerance protein CutA [Planctomycetota bacterium]